MTGLTLVEVHVQVGVPAAAALRAGPQLGVEGGEGGGRALTGRLSHRGVEGGVVEDRHRRPRGRHDRHVVKRYAGHSEAFSAGMNFII